MSCVIACFYVIYTCFYNIGPKKEFWCYIFVSEVLAKIFDFEEGIELIFFIERAFVGMAVYMIYIFFNVTVNLYTYFFVFRFI